METGFLFVSRWWHDNLVLANTNMFSEEIALMC